MSLNILTLAELKSLVGISDTDEDTLITLWAESLQDRFDDHCNRSLVIGNYEETFDGGGSWLFLDAYPVVSITSITIDSTALTAANYTLNNARGRIAYQEGEAEWPDGEQTIVVSYRGGYVATGDTPATGETAMPGAIKRAMMLQFEHEWRNRQHLGISQVSAKGVSINAGAQVSLALKRQTLMPEVESALLPYVRMI